MAADFAIRPALVDDASRLSKLAARTFTETFGADNRPEDLAEYVASSFNSERIAQEIADPSALTLVAESGAELVGYAQLRRSEAPPEVTGPAPIELVRIYVLADRLGAGIGRALMARCLAEAHGMGAQTLWLGVWERNPRAIAFYVKWGFRRVGDHVFLLGRDEQTDWVMERDLSDIRADRTCDAAEHHQFDFWLGDWVVFGADGTEAGRNLITRVVGGCGLREEWTGRSGLTGTSLNTWSPERGAWHQTWIDAAGTLLLLEGGLRDGVMVLEGTTADPEHQGAIIRHRISWSVIDGNPDQVRQHWQTSSADGAWETAFDGRYERVGG